MVNPDSDLFRAHPDWVLSGSRARPPLRGLAPPAGARPGQPRPHAFIRDRLDALPSDHDIAFLKWDHNRDLIEAGHAGRPGVHAQTLAVYRLWTSCANATRASRSRAARRAAAGSTWGSWPGPTGSGPATPTTPWSASPSSAGPSCWSCPSWSAATSARPGPHHRPRPRPRPGRHGAVRPLRHRVGHRLGLGRRAGGAGRGDRLLPADAAAAPRPGGGTGRPPRPGRLPPRGGGRRPRRGAVRLRAAHAPRRSRRRPGPAARADPDRAYRVEPVAVAGEPETKQAMAPAWLEAGGVTLGGRALAEVGLPCPCSGPSRPCCSMCGAASPEARRPGGAR